MRMGLGGDGIRIDMWYGLRRFSGCLFWGLGDSFNEFYEALTVRLGSNWGDEFLVVRKSLCVLSVVFL
jgi:hypothetical protein